MTKCSSAGHSPFPGSYWESDKTMRCSICSQRYNVSENFDKDEGHVSSSDAWIRNNFFRGHKEDAAWTVINEWLTPEELRGYIKGTVYTLLCREESAGRRENIEEVLRTIQLFLGVSK